MGTWQIEIMGRRMAWPDCGTRELRLEKAATFVGSVERRHEVKIAHPGEIAFRAGWMTAAAVAQLTQWYKEGSDCQHLLPSMGALTGSQATKGGAGSAGEALEV